jgi:hypothetical protein
MGSVSRWITNPTNDVLLEPLGYWLGVLGFVITLGGFWIGYVKLKKIQAAADAAKMAVDSFKIKLVHYEALNDATEAGTSVRSIQRHVRNDGWKDAGETYEIVRSAIGRICTVLDPELDLVILSDVVTMNQQISALCSTIETSIYGATKPFPDKPKTLKMIRAHSDLLIKLERILRERAL